MIVDGFNSTPWGGKEGCYPSSYPIFDLLFYMGRQGGFTSPLLFC
jgi:hypothetical protein